MTLRQRIRLFQQLSTLTRAGIPLVVALQRLQEKLPATKTGKIALAVQAGLPAAEAFRQTGFSPFECNLISVGTQSARLEIVFAHLAEFWIYEADLRDALKVQLIYPVIVLHFSILVSAVPGAISGGVFGFLQVLLLNLFWLYLLLGPICALIYFTWSHETAKRFWLFWPLIGNTLRTTFAYRWITALRLEYSAGIPLPDAVADAWRASTFPGAALLAVEGADQMRQSVELSQLIRHWPWLPRDWSDFVETGEISGAMEASFNTLAEEAGKASALAQQQLRMILPKVLYFLVMIIVAIQILEMAWKTVISPIQSLNSVLP